MIGLMEILNSIKDKKKDGLIPIDDWKLSEAEYLVDMGFKEMDEYKFTLEGNPRLVIFKKKTPDKVSGDLKEYYFLDDRTDIDFNGKPIEKNEIEESDSTHKITKIKKFPTFEDVESYFNQYKQPDLEKNL